MPVTDTISDFLTRIRNAGSARHKELEMPCSNMKVNIAKILKEQGYIEDYEKIENAHQGVLKIKMRYYNGDPVILKIERISKPGRRVYTDVKGLPRVKNGLGTAIISTSHGVMTDKQARKDKLGGEVLCTIW